MGDRKGFLKHQRADAPYRAVSERIKDWDLVTERFTPELVRHQASRCMDCGVPFCMQGCPLGNLIPDWNDLVYRDQWRAAITKLHSTNNFPEFTGLLCPAPCESACVLGISQDPVSIKQVEWEIIQRAYDEGWVQPEPSKTPTGRTVAIVGSGPAGLAAAQQLARAGHSVTVFEKTEKVGGLLRYGIPDFKLEKWIIDRRLEQLIAEGIQFRTGCAVGTTISVDELLSEFDALLLCTGAERPRELQIPGRELDGVHFAMDFLCQQNRRVAGQEASSPAISAKGKHVIVLGGGDTGSDCVGTALRQGAASVTSLELLPMPPEGRHRSEPWPQPKRYSFQVSSSHAEGGERRFSALSTEFVGEAGQVKALRVCDVAFERDDLDRPILSSLQQQEGSDATLPADLVLLALGFEGPKPDELSSSLGVDCHDSGLLIANTHDFATSHSGVFAAGDCRRGASLIVWAQWEGREAARHVDAFLMGSSRLPSRDAY